jgi:hypothetical protein
MVISRDIGDETSKSRAGMALPQERIITFVNPFHPISDSCPYNGQRDDRQIMTNIDKTLEKYNDTRDNILLKQKQVGPREHEY